MWSKPAVWWALVGLAVLDLVSFVLPVFAVYVLVSALFWPEGLRRAAGWLQAASERPE